MTDSPSRPSEPVVEVLETVECALRDAFPVMLREFLYSEAARDVTGHWGFTNLTGDDFREDLLKVARGGSALV
jgi:hypothetical protein